MFAVAILDIKHMPHLHAMLVLMASSIKLECAQVAVREQLIRLITMEQLLSALASIALI